MQLDKQQSTLCAKRSMKPSHGLHLPQNGILIPNKCVKTSMKRSSFPYARNPLATSENYRVVKQAVLKHMNEQELQEARELRDYEKMRAKEKWQARKAQFKQELEDLAVGWKGSRQKLTAVREGMKADFRVEKLRRKEEKFALKLGWKRKERRISAENKADAVADEL
ncbi:MAG: hypothetical protein Q9201_005244 [Fulgogasparrea decipioides]